MLILISCLLLFGTALVLIALRVFQPQARYTWLVAVSGAMLGMLSIFSWRLQLPFNWAVSGWSSVTALNIPFVFYADEISFPFALSIAALTLAILLTSVTQPVFINSWVWSGIVALGAFGILAVTAYNPLTLLLMWSILDLTELIIYLAATNGSANNEKIVISFSARALGIGLLLWASILSIADTNSFNFENISARSAFFLVLASSLRLGVFPFRFPYIPSGEQVKRGLSIALQLITVASSLILLGRVSIEILNSTLVNVFIVFSIAVALYAGWMWLRSPDELTGRPYWMIAIASFAIISALTGNPIGATAWGCALILVGGVLFLSTIQNTWLNRIILIGVWSVSTLPFSLTASVWLGQIGFFAPLIIIAQALMTTGLIRNTLRVSRYETFDDQAGWMRAMYVAGIVLLLVMQLIVGLISWNITYQIGAWIQALVASMLTFGLLWASQRFRIFKPMRAHWVALPESQKSYLYEGVWSVYRFLGQINQIITQTLEGEGGIMWTWLFLVLFISLILQAAS